MCLINATLWQYGEYRKKESEQFHEQKSEECWEGKRKFRFCSYMYLR